MRTVVRAVCLAFAVTAFVGSPTLALGGVLPAPGSPGGSSLLESPLMVPQVQPLDGGQQVRADVLSRRSSPEAVAEREASQRRFAGLSAVRATRLAAEAFPTAIDAPAGGPPSLSRGEKIVGYAARNVARIELPGKQLALIESSAPMAVETAPGKRLPLDLGLRQAGNAFEPARSVVGVRIPERLDQGVDLGTTDVSLTPVDRQGSPLDGSAGTVTGASVLYANTQTDADTVVKPTTGGFEADTLLRSVDSPEQLFFRVGLPAGARLARAKHGSGAIQVAEQGTVIATVLPPTAVDAAGTAVPVSMSVSGDLLSLTVEHPLDEYRYPIEVDPSVIDEELTGRTQPTNWRFSGTPAFAETGLGSTEGLTDSTAGYAGNESGVFKYPILPGSEAQVSCLSIESAGYDGSESLENLIRLVSSKEEVEKVSQEPVSYSRVSMGLYCGEDKGKEGHPGNAAEFGQFTTGAGGPASYTMYRAFVEIRQTPVPTLSFDSTDPTVDGGKANVLYGSGRWLGPSSGAFEAKAHDKGVGISYLGIAAGAWSEHAPILESGECVGVQCDESFAKGFTYNSKMKDGSDSVEAIAYNAMGSYAEARPVVKVDGTAPHGITLTGLPAGNEIGEGQYHVQTGATDGSGTTSSSGIASIAVSVDGKSLGSVASACSPGPCTSSAEWTISGKEYSAGHHTLVVSATDNAGNVATETFGLTERAATPVPVGPGTVNPTTGELALSATDVSIGSPGTALSVSRSYRSRHLTAGSEGPLGPQWSMAISGEQSLIKQPGGMVLVAADGEQTMFASKGSHEFAAPPGDSGLSLTEVLEGSKTKEFVLKDVNGSETQFTLPEGGTGVSWTPRVSEGPNATDVAAYAFKTVGGVTEPSLELAPKPAGVSCSVVKLEKHESTEVGCRALTFTYATATKASGEAPSEWGEYNGRLTKVTFTAWNPSTKAMANTVVAEYAYDTQGRLRAVWNPAVSPNLKTIYGYDAEGHVSAVSPPGVQPWLLRYGTTPADTNAGRLLSVTRPPASTEAELKSAKEASAPGSSTAPTLSSTKPVIGTTLSVSGNGSWTHSPLAYAYQWEDCSSSGGECAPVPGAVNASYTPQARDAGYALEVAVSAQNASGATVASTAASSVIAMPAPTYSSAFSIGPLDVQDAVDSAGNLWIASNSADKVEKYSPGGTLLASYGAAGSGNLQFSSPWGIAINNTTGNVYVTDSGNNRVQELSASGTFIRAFGTGGTGLGQFNVPAGIAVEQSSGALWVADAGGNRVEKFSANGEALATFGSNGSGNGQFATPKGITSSGGIVYVADGGNNRVEELSPQGAYLGQFGSGGSGNGQFSTPNSIAIDPVSGELYVTDMLNSRVQIFNPAGQYVAQFGSAGTGAGQFAYPRGIAVGATGTVYVVDSENNRLQTWKPSYSTNNPVPAPPGLGSSAVWTIDYQVPVSGAGAAYPMSEKEVEKWGQKDDPVEATAIFPPDKPEGWPASEYARATVYYLDSLDNTVNVASPTGGIATTEYSKGVVSRALTADNRALALKEGSKSAEQAALLDSESTYNAEGTQLQETLGPQHNVKLPGGTQAQARAVTHYFYEEGAPAGGPYNLATKITEGALVSGKEEDVRTSTTAFGGQENLGWKLRQPTSTVTDPSGAKITHTTIYEAATGNVLETRMPADPSGESSPPTYSLQFGKLGSGEGQLSHPVSDAVDSGGNVWVTDQANYRIEKFSPEGAYLSAVGSKGTGNGQFTGVAGIAVNLATGNLYVVDAGATAVRVEELSSAGAFLRAFGSKGSGNGQLEAPSGIALDAAGNVWVADTGNGRVVEFSAEGTFLRNVGSPGSGNGQLSGPTAVALSEGNLYVADRGNNRIEELSTAGAYLAQFGTKGSGNGQLSSPAGIEVDPSSGNLYVTDTLNNRIEEFTPSGAFLAKLGAEGTGNGQFQAPSEAAIGAKGVVYVVDQGNNRVEKLLAPSAGHEGAHDARTIYYASEANAASAACGGHPEWAGLPCQTEPLDQPETGSLANLPVTSFTYNMWDQVERTTQAAGTATRTTTATYDSAGRPSTTAISSSVGTALPTVTDEYDETKGMLKTQSLTINGVPQKILSSTNTLGQLSSYTDADEAKTSYTYDIDGRQKTATDPEGKQTLIYSPTTGEATELVDTAAGKFTASYDAEGEMLTQGYPNGMVEKLTADPASETTGLEYEKTTHCSSSCTWFKDTVVPTIHTQWATQTSTLSSQSYAYDGSGRLSEVQDTPAGGTCTARLYSDDADTNRTSLTTRTSGSGTCATTGGTTETHAYDSADRLIDGSLAYDAFGNITTLSAADAGGSTLTSTFYADNQLATQAQNGETIGYNLDPAGRTVETISTGKTSSDILSHYDSGSDSPSWTVEPASGHTTRNIPGLDGGLAATQTNAGTPVIQLTNLHGDVVATVPDIETETKLQSTSDTTEYGVPRTGVTPPRYSYLGGDERSTELPTGIVAMGARSYVPELGRFLQTDPKPGGSANAYTYTYGDPVNASDPSGAWTFATPQWLENFDANWTAGGEAREAARLAAARAEAEARAREAAERAGAEAALMAEVAAGEAAMNSLEESAFAGMEGEGGFSGCTGTGACASGLLGFKVNLGKITDWWQKVKKGYKLVMETVAPPLLQEYNEQTSVCKLTGYAIAAGSNFIPSQGIGKYVGYLVGFGTTYAC